MFSRIILCLAVAAMFIPNAAAKTEDVPPPALYKSYPADAEVDAQLLFLDRVSFVKEMYTLSNEEMETVLKVLQGLVPRQEQYDDARCVSLRRIRIAMNLVASDDSRDEASKQRLVSRFQDQINRIHEIAPMSFGNVIKATEKVLPAEKVEAGQKRVLEFLASRTGLKTEEIDVAQIDTLLAGRVAPGEKPEMPQPPPQTDNGSRLHSRPYGPTPDERARQRAGRNLPQPKGPIAQDKVESSPRLQEPKPQPTTKSEVLAERLRTKKTPPKPVAPRIIEPAPPITEWKASYDETAARYGYSDKQKQAGEAVVRGVMSRAAKLQAKSEGGDEGAKTDATKKLDRLYDEMKQRLDSIATIEQRQKVAGEGKKEAEAASASAEKAAE